MLFCWICVWNSSPPFWLWLKISDDTRLDLFDLIDPDTDVLDLHSVDI